MVRGTVILLDNDLFLRPRMTADLEREGWIVRFAPGAEAFRSALEDGAEAILVNLAARALPWPVLVGVARRSHPDLPIVGFGPHADEHLRAQGLAAGCTDVVPNGAIAKSAARIVGDSITRPAPRVAGDENR